MVEREHVCTFQGDLFRPTLFKLGEVVERALSGHFKDVSCNVVECPDLCEFGLAREGLGGDPTYVECGGVYQSMFNPARQRDVYTLAKVAGAVGVEDAFVLGAGAASATECSCCAELTVNAELKAGKITNKSKIARISDMNVLPETREITTGDARGQVGCICNLFYSSGGAGRVLEARARVRNPDAATSRDPHDQEFIRLVRLALAKEWPQKEKHIVLGGVLLVNKGKTLTHVMPPYFPPAGATPGKSFPDMKGWGERFFVPFQRLLLVRDPSGRGPSLPRSPRSRSSGARRSSTTRALASRAASSGARTTRTSTPRTAPRRATTTTTSTRGSSSTSLTSRPPRTSRRWSSRRRRRPPPPRRFFTF